MVQAEVFPAIHCWTTAVSGTKSASRLASPIPKSGDAKNVSSVVVGMPFYGRGDDLADLKPAEGKERSCHTR